VNSPKNRLYPSAESTEGVAKKVYVRFKAVFFADFFDVRSVEIFFINPKFRSITQSALLLTRFSSGCCTGITPNRIQDQKSSGRSKRLNDFFKKNVFLIIGQVTNKKTGKNALITAGFSIIFQ